MATSKYVFEETAPTYEFKASGNPYSHRGRSRKNSYGDASDDGNGSLTYSASSSIRSSGGESTDSSFAEIRRALEAQGGADSKELAAYLKRLHHNHGGRGDEKSLAADSLAYSTDADSHLRFAGGGDSLAYSADSYARSLATDLESHLHGSDFASGSGYVYPLRLELPVRLCFEEFCDRIL